jgi:hypothetical protein
MSRVTNQGHWTYPRTASGGGLGKVGVKRTRGPDLAVPNNGPSPLSENGGDLQWEKCNETYSESESFLWRKSE